MKKSPFVAVVISVVFVVLNVSSLAAPSAVLQMALADVTEEENEVFFTIKISIGVPSESYASLDFSLVSSDSGALSIAPKNHGSRSGDLDITFADGYGSAYHNGRFDGSEVRYLLGIYGRNGGNVITDATDICSIRMKYTGDAAHTLSIADSKLIYKNSNGVIVSAPVTAELPTLQISRESLHSTIVTEVSLLSDDGSTGLGTLQVLVFVLLAAIGVTAMLHRGIKTRR